MSSAEDPEKILDQVVEEMQGDLIKMRQAAATVSRFAGWGVCKAALLWACPCGRACPSQADAALTQPEPNVVG